MIIISMLRRGTNRYPMKSETSLATCALSLIELPKDQLESIKQFYKHLPV